MVISRRNVLRGAVITTASLFFVDARDLIRASALTAPGPRRTVGLQPGSHAIPTAATGFFLYGYWEQDPSAQPSVETGSLADLVSIDQVADQLATVPVRSPDGATVAVVRNVRDSTGTTITTLLLDAATGGIGAEASFDLSDPPGTATVLVTPVFSADSQSVCLVLSITTATDFRSITRTDPRTGDLETLQSATRVSHHALAYVNCQDGKSAGPYHLPDAPSLARVNAFADRESLYVWTIIEPSTVLTSKSPDLLAPVPQLSAYPLGSGAARFKVPAPGPWPVNGEPVVSLGESAFVRLAYGSQLEVYSSADGTAIRIPISELQDVGARPAPATMDVLADGRLVVAKPGIGRATIVDPKRGFKTSAVIQFPIPAHSAGPFEQVAISALGDTLYVVGGPDTNGIVSYDVISGKQRAIAAIGQEFIGLHILPSGELLGVRSGQPNLILFSGDLTQIGSGNTNKEIAAVV